MVWRCLPKVGALLAAGVLLMGCHSEPVNAPIAFLAQADDHWQVWWIKTPGAPAARIGRLTEDVSRMSWFPDGRSLLVNLQGGRWFKLDVASGEATALQPPAAGTFDAVVSPDGKQIAYSVSMGSSTDRNDLWTVDIATDATQKITAIPGLQHEPAWSPDGRSLYFLSGRGGPSHDIWRVDIASRAVTQMTVNDLFHFDIAVRDDGAIAYSSNRGGNYDLWMMRKDGKPERLTDDAALDARPAWSPDGERLVFESTRGGASDLWTYDLSSKAFTRLTQMPGGARMPVWAPAGGAR
jgi:TolB protein